MQSDLFASASERPEGMVYAPDAISAKEERQLLNELCRLPFKEFEFHGFLGKRRVVSFGWRHDFNGSGLANPMHCRGARGALGRA